jgi:hypothetical protein
VGRDGIVSTPQQPELRRSGRGASDPASAKANVDSAINQDEAPGPVPVDNQPGHHPEREQDKPEAAQG